MIQPAARTWRKKQILDLQSSWRKSHLNWPLRGRQVGCFFFNQRIISFQGWVGFSCKTVSISYTYTHIPSLLILPPLHPLNSLLLRCIPTASYVTPSSRPKGPLTRCLSVTVLFMSLQHIIVHSDHHWPKKNPNPSRELMWSPRPGSQGPLSSCLHPHMHCNLLFLGESVLPQLRISDPLLSGLFSACKRQN